MKKHILHAAVLATGAIVFVGIAQAGDNNVDGVAQYERFKERYNEQINTETHYKPMASESVIGNPANQKVSDIEPAAGRASKGAHEDNANYNQ